MALSSANAGGQMGRGFSIGPVKVQKKTISAESGDTSGDVTFDSLTSIDHVEVEGLVLSAAVTMSGNVATLAFTDPAATVYGTISAYGR